jgi:hypothetical protein
MRGDTQAACYNGQASSVAQVDGTVWLVEEVVMVVRSGGGDGDGGGGGGGWRCLAESGGKGTRRRLERRGADGGRWGGSDGASVRRVYRDQYYFALHS